MASSLAVPVLMYHKVGYPVASRTDRFLNVSARDFARQMHLLASLGYQARTFAEVVDALTGGKRLPRRTVAITFDDGYACIGQAAAPVLAAQGFPGTVFVVSQAVGTQNGWDEMENLPVIPLLDWTALRTLQAAGWEIGGHTRSHPHLDMEEEARALQNIVEGKRETEAQLGRGLRTFCYPFGHFNANTPGLVRKAGFLGACTTRSGIAHADLDPFLLPRVKIAYRDGALGLLYRLLVRPYLPDLRPQRRSQQTTSASEKP